MTTSFLLFYLFSHKLFEEKNLATNIIIALAELFRYSKSLKGQFDANMMLTCPFLGRKDGIETLKEFKSGTSLRVLVYFVFHNIVMQNFTAI